MTNIKLKITYADSEMEEATIDENLMITPITKGGAMGFADRKNLMNFLFEIIKIMKTSSIRHLELEEEG